MPNYPDKRKWALIIGYICAACLIFIIAFTIFNISSTLISTTESITQPTETGEIGTQNGTPNPNATSPTPNGTSPNPNGTSPTPNGSSPNTPNSTSPNSNGTSPNANSTSPNSNGTSPNTPNSTSPSTPNGTSPNSNGTSPNTPNSTSPSTPNGTSPNSNGTNSTSPNPNAPNGTSPNPNGSPNSENSGAPLFGIKNIKIDGFVGDLRLIEGDEFTVLCNKTAKNYTISTNHETLEISSNSDINAFLNHFTGRKVPKLTITIPKNLILDTLEINLAPSSLLMENISAENFTLQSPVSSGKIKGGRLNNAQIKTGLGTIKISAELKGNCSIETGIGETKIEIQGEKSDYYISAENAIGTLKIDGENFSGETGNPSAENKIKLKNAIGETTLKFPH